MIKKYTYLKCNFHNKWKWQFACMDCDKWNCESFKRCLFSEKCHSWRDTPEHLMITNMLSYSHQFRCPRELMSPGDAHGAGKQWGRVSYRPSDRRAAAWRNTPQETMRAVCSTAGWCAADTNTATASWSVQTDITLMLTRLLSYKWTNITDRAGVAKLSFTRRLKGVDEK